MKSKPVTWGDMINAIDPDGMMTRQLEHRSPLTLLFFDAGKDGTNHMILRKEYGKRTWCMDFYAINQDARPIEHTARFTDVTLSMAHDVFMRATVVDAPKPGSHAYAQAFIASHRAND